ncbi:MAG: alpha/beta fold hydrolase [Gemmataceae bacterium]
MSSDWEHKFADLDGLKLHYVEAGSGPLVVLLHGFPEFWYSWRFQIPALAQAGFRVLAPDLRGYNLSDKPKGVSAYRVHLLAGDIAGLIRHAGAARAHIVGHDWGGGVAWWLAIQKPEVVERLAVLNCPHPAAFWRELRRPGQLLRSWYMFFFQVPWLPERLMRLRDFASLENTFRSAGFSSDDIEQYKEALRQPGALTAAINYYRAMFRNSRSLGQPMPRLSLPTMLVWGKHDDYLGIALTQNLDPWVQDLRLELLEASHWVQCDAADQVNRLLIDFLGRP